METSEEANQITYNILDIPNELLNAIVELISEEARSRVRLVSRLFFDLIGRSHFSLGLIMPSEMEQLVRVFGRYQKPISLTFNKLPKGKSNDLTHVTYFRYISTLTQLTSLDVNGSIDRSVLISLTSKLVSLKVGGNTVVPTCTLQHLSNLTCLRVNVTGDASETVILTNLESLDMTNRNASWPNITCPKVTSLTLRSQTSPPQEWLAQFKPKTMVLQHTSSSPSLHYQLPSGSCQNLTSLSIEGITIDNKSEVPWHQLKELSLSFVTKTTDSSVLQHVSKCTSLMTLHINSYVDQATLDAIAFQEMRQLQSLIFSSGPAQFGSVKNLISKLNKDSLKTLRLTVYQDHEECFVEISKMTKLKYLSLSICHLTLDYEPIDLSSLMTMTFLTSLALNPSRCFGLHNLTCMTNLNTLKIIASDPNRPLKKLKLVSFTKLTDLELVKCVNVVDLRGATQLTRFSYDAPDKNTSAIELIAEDLTNLKEISLGLLATPIPWTTISKFTALESLVIDAFETDDTITQLQNLKRLTRLSNRSPLAYSCNHLNPDYLTHLKQLQYIFLVVPKTGLLASIEPNLPRLTTMKEFLCMKCGKGSQLGSKVKK